MIPISRMPISSQRQSSDSEDSSHIIMKSPFIDTATTPGKLFSDPSEFPLTGRPSLAGRSSWRSNGTMRLAFLLTVLQFTFAMYATFLLYWMSPSVPDLKMQPDTSFWTDQFGKIFPTTSHKGSRLVLENPGLEVQRTTVFEVRQRPKSVVCESEEIAFPQMKSNNTKMIEIKTGLFRSGQLQIRLVQNVEILFCI